MAWTKKGKLYDALFAGDLQSVQGLIALYGDYYKTLDHNSIIDIAVRKAQPQILEYLFACGFKINPETMVARAYIQLTDSSCDKPDAILETARILINQGIPFEEKEKFSLLEAAFDTKKYYLIPFLIDHGADLKLYPELVYDLMTENADKEIILKAIEAGADINSFVHKTKDTPLRLAVQKGDVDIVKKILAKGCNVNAIALDSFGARTATALHVAVSTGSIEMIKILLEAGARIDIKNHNNQTPLNIARENKSSHIIINMLEQAEEQLAQKMGIQTPASKKEEASETWHKCGTDQVTYVGVFPQVGRKVTEMFNFSARTRIVILENLADKKETPLPPENFSMVGNDRLEQACDAFEKQGGQVDRAKILPHKIVRNFVEKPHPA